MWDARPQLLPVAFAVVVGGHFLPFGWIDRTRIYVALGVAISAGSFALAVASGSRALHCTGFLVGANLALGAFAAPAHARTRAARGRATSAPLKF